MDWLVLAKQDMTIYPRNEYVTLNHLRPAELFVSACQSLEKAISICEPLLVPPLRQICVPMNASRRSTVPLQHEIAHAWWKY